MSCNMTTFAGDHPIFTLVFALIGAALAYDYIYPRFYYDWRAKRHGGAALKKNVAFPFGLSTMLEMRANQRRHAELEQGLKFRDAEHNTFLVQIFSNAIVTRHPENIKSILSTQFNEFGIGHRYELLSPYFGNGIFAADGEHWHKSRQLLRPLFLRERVSNLEMIESHFKSLISYIDSHQGSPVELQMTLRRFTADSALHFLFGLQLDTLNGQDMVIPLQNGDTMRSGDLFAHLQNISEWLSIRTRLGKLYWLSDRAKYTNSIKTIHSFTDEVVRRTVELDSEKADLGSEEYSFVKDLLRETSDRKLVRDQALTLFSAGFDTTSSLLSQVLMFLTTTHKYDKLRKIVLEEIGPDVEGITFESLKSCKYLQACLNESLRVLPVVPVNFRTAKKDLLLPRGGGDDGQQPVFVPKGTMVVFHSYALQRDKEVWGEDADEFRPERWENLKVPGWSYIPFLGGPRLCLGQQFALTEAAYVLARFCQEYSSITGPGMDAYKFRMAVSVAVVPGVSLKFQH